MKQPRRSNLLAYALFANALMLGGILIVLICQMRVSMVPSALGDVTSQPPIAGGAGIYVMPCQFHPTVWGCYLLDTNNQTLCTYEYRAGERLLVLTAARHYRYDLGLKDMNTYPAWYDVKKQVEDAEKAQQIEQPKAPQAGQ